MNYLELNSRQDKQQKLDIHLEGWMFVYPGENAVEVKSDGLDNRQSCEVTVGIPHRVTNKDRQIMGDCSYTTTDM